MYYSYASSKKFNVIICFTIITFFLNSIYLYSNDSFKENTLKFNLLKKNDIFQTYLGDDKLLKGVLRGNISMPAKNFEKAEISCDLLGRSYKGRGFSCGFAEVEDLNGYCFIYLPNQTDTILTKWECTTTAGLSGDAVCNGKLNIVSGNGKFVGVIGFGNIELPLAKSILEKKKDYLLKIKLKIKYPLNIKQN